MQAWLVVPVALVLLGCGGADREAEPELSAPSPAPASAPPPRRALWVLAEGSRRVLEDPGRIEQLVADAARLGVSDLLVQVYRGGRSWFPSEAADDSPYRGIVGEDGDPPLPALVERAHAQGIRVHAWFNALSLARNDDAPLLRSVGREAVLVDREGRSLLDYPRHDVPPPDRSHVQLGTPGVWLDPAVPGVVEYLERTLDDLIAAAPELDGLHLDFIRHPLALPFAPGSRFDVGLDFGYGELTRARYERETGFGFRRGDRWDRFRRERVDELVQRLAARVPEGWEMSAAVLPWADRAYLVAMQDWRGWLEEGWMDFVVAMAYTRDDRLLRYVAHGLRGGIGGDRVWLGLGSWLFLKDPARMVSQIEVAQDVGSAGLALFSYDSLIDAPQAWAALPWAAP